MLKIAFKQGLGFASGRLVDWAFSSRLEVAQPRQMLQVAFGQSARRSGALLVVAFETRQDRIKPLFGSSQVLGMGAYDIRVRIDGKDIDACRLLAAMSISHAENQSYLCDFWLREDIGLIDVYKWHSKDIQVDVVHAGGVMRIYMGVVDISNFHFSARRREVKCSDRRLLQINRLPAAVVRAIGYTSKSAHGEFKDLAAEMAARLETVPASFEFDANGTGYLTSWQPKAVPDRVIGRCEVYSREPRMGMLPVGRVLNKVNIKLANQFMRLWQRDVDFSFESGYHVCVYHWFGLPPAVADMKTAIEQAGWAWSNWRSEGLEKGGWYRCNGAMWMWSPVSRRVLDSKDKNSSNQSDVTAVSVQDFTDYYARRAWWSASRRWTQNADDVYTMTLQNKPSIDRYGEITEELQYTVHHEERDEDWGRDYRFGQQPPKGFKQANNGDWYKDLNGEMAQELRDTLQVAYWTAYTKILASHRENTLDLEMKFLPEIDLRHTHRIELDNFVGNAKVASFTHQIDFVRKVSQTSVQYKFYQNAQDGAITPFAMPAPPAMPILPKVERQVRLGTVVLPYGAKPEIDGLNGFIVQTKRLPSIREHEVRSRIAFAVTTADVEKVLTDTMETEAATTTEVGIPDGHIMARMV